MCWRQSMVKLSGERAGGFMLLNAGPDKAFGKCLHCQKVTG